MRRKWLLVLAGLTLLGILMVGAMVAFGFAISQPEQRRLDSRPRVRTETPLTRMP